MSRRSLVIQSVLGKRKWDRLQVFSRASLSPVWRISFWPDECIVHLLPLLLYLFFSRNGIKGGWQEKVLNERTLDSRVVSAELCFGQNCDPLSFLSSLRTKVFVVFQFFSSKTCSQFYNNLSTWIGFYLFQMPSCICWWCVGWETELTLKSRRLEFNTTWKSRRIMQNHELTKRRAIDSHVMLRLLNEWCVWSVISVFFSIVYYFHGVFFAVF